jgi:hypothetical protein
MTVEAEALEKSKNIITITIINDGNRYTDSFNVHEKVRKVIHDGLKAFGIDVSQVPNYILRYGNVNLDDHETSLQDYNIPSGAELILAPRQARAGA